MKPKWQKQASMAQEICTLWFQFFGAVFASKGYPFKNIFGYMEFHGSYGDPLRGLNELGCTYKQSFISAATHHRALNLQL